MRSLIVLLMAITVNLTDLPTITNAAFWPLYGSAKRYNVLVGGAGSGKSVFAAQREVVKSLTSPGIRILCIRKVANTIKDSVYAELQGAMQHLGVSSIYRAFKSPLEFHNLYNGSVLLCRGLDDPEKIKSIKGINRIWIEEATELTQDDFEQLDLRIRGRSKYPKQITLTFNPISQLHWLRKHFWEDLPGTEVDRLKTTYRDNRFLDAADIKKIERLKKQNPSLYRIYGEGEWGILEGLIYEPPRLDVPYPKTFDEEFYGLDFGFNNPCALIWIGTKDFNRKTLEGDLFVRELVYECGLDTPELAARMKERGVRRSARIYCDPAEPARIKGLRKHGFVGCIPADKGPGSVSAGIDLCRSLRIHSCPENSNYNAERSTYAWKQDRFGNYIDEPVKFNDHLMDGKRYAVFTHFGKPRVDLW